jgi:hypothetical protein
MKCHAHVIVTAPHPYVLLRPTELFRMRVIICLALYFLEDAIGVVLLLRFYTINKETIIVKEVLV